MATLRSVPETRPTSAALSNTLGTDGLAYHLDDNLAPGAPTSYSKVCQRLSAERIQPVAENS